MTWTDTQKFEVQLYVIHVDAAYEEMTAQGVSEALKEKPSTKIVRRVMRNTYPRRRKWILEESPTVASVLESFPALKTSKYVSS